MNWNKIKTDCPKGREEWSGFVSEYPFIINERACFDFFDEREIYIGIHPMEEVETGLHTGFVWNIGDENDMLPHRPRPEAESAAFEKAFQILEERLNKEA